MRKSEKIFEIFNGMKTYKFRTCSRDLKMKWIRALKARKKKHENINQSFKSFSFIEKINFEENIIKEVNNLLENDNLD